jgi:hypothetical protein
MKKFTRRSKKFSRRKFKKRTKRVSFKKRVDRVIKSEAELKFASVVSVTAANIFNSQVFYPLVTASNISTAFP